MGIVDDLVGKALRGLTGLQVSGRTRLDGGTVLQGPAQLNDTDLAALVRSVPRRIASYAVPPGATPSVISFPNLDQSFDLLVIWFRARCDTPASGLNFINWRKNAVSSGSYDTETLPIFGTVTQVPLETLNINAGRCGVMPGPAAAGATWFSVGRIEIPFYSDDVSLKKVVWDCDGSFGTLTTGVRRYLGSSQVKDNTDPISQLDFLVEGGANFVFGTQFVVYAYPGMR